MWARPTPAGERVWIWLRPGLSLDDLQDRLDKIAVACWATAALAETASRSNAAFVRLDIKRRDVLTGTITSPLLDMIKSGTPATQRDTTEIPTALDLPQVPASEVTTRPADTAQAAGSLHGRLLRHHPRPRLPATAATSPTGSDPARTGAISRHRAASFPGLPGWHPPPTRAEPHGLTRPGVPRLSSEGEPP